MKIVVVSDSHGNRDELDKIVRMNSEVDLFLHAGDSGLSKFEIAPYVSVKGNCDYETDFPTYFKIQTPYGNLYMTHGHRMSVLTKEKMDTLDAKIFILGHTHMKRVKKIKDCYIFNPGSVTLPRDSSIGSYLILNITKTEVKYEFVNVK